MKLGKLTQRELKTMAEDIMHIFNSYHSTTKEDLRLNHVEFSSNKKIGIEMFASDSEGNGVSVVKVTFNEARDCLDIVGV